MSWILKGIWEEVSFVSARDCGKCKILSKAGVHVYQGAGLEAEMPVML